jgi:hypothetical protein
MPVSKREPSVQFEQNGASIIMLPRRQHLIPRSDNTLSNETNSVQSMINKLGHLRMSTPEEKEHESTEDYHKKIANRPTAARADILKIINSEDDDFFDW